MSLATWKKEFYSPISRVNKKDAIAHSLKKWEGLIGKNLKKHGVKFDGGTLRDKSGGFHFDEDTCSLCKHYIYLTTNACEKCPLNKLTRGRSCYRQYEVFVEKNKPWPMITLLREAKRNEIQSRL